MTDHLFTLSEFALAGWILLIVFPRWPLTRAVAKSALVPAYLAALYTAGIVPLLIAAGPGILRDFSSADGVVRLMSGRDAALIVWIHLLTFDQLVGVIIYRDNMEHRIVSLPAQSAILLLTLLFGPVGFAVYYGIRLAARRGPAFSAAMPPASVG